MNMYSPEYILLSMHACMRTTNECCFALPVDGYFISRLVLKVKPNNACFWATILELENVRLFFVVFVYPTEQGLKTRFVSDP